ncbi:MAG: 2-oxoglutarate dehydrogenase complex dihydrolipoyllysine-residue succinyltransferase [Bacteroidales bacterium]|nr:2-oxoglutarate dehydrogenase complex dihydrolipoyllysine-residue succinyltransferase [Bacteroidales bacterium]
MTDIVVPSPGESISQVIVAQWLVQSGDYVAKDQEIVEIDSDKATLAISAPVSGIIEISAQAGDTVDVGSVIAHVTPSKSGPKDAGSKSVDKVEHQEAKGSIDNMPPGLPEPKAPLTTAEKEKSIELQLSPLAQRLMDIHEVSESELLEFYKHYRLKKEDVEFFLKNRDAERPAVPITRDEEREKMSPLRVKLAQRLVSVKNETAMLTTFNEADMSEIIRLRKLYKEEFKEKHGVSLGFMSFFVKAVAIALKEIPSLNAMIDGDEIVRFNYADIGIAVSTPKGLMVPVLRNAEDLSLADIERQISDLASRARNRRLSLDEMSGGTFTITNGGVFGSLLSTPIINPPQSGILGMHNIQERPVAINGEVHVRPMMYIAMSYDHRIVDGKESVTFLVKVKEMLENPEKMLFGGKPPASALLQI